MYMFSMQDCNFCERVITVEDDRELVYDTELGQVFICDECFSTRYGGATRPAAGHPDEPPMLTWMRETLGSIANETEK